MVDFWQSVTGSLNFNESDPYQTALRELFEETGLGPQDGVLSNLKHAEWFTIYPERLRFYPPGICYNYEHVFRFCLHAPVSICLSREHSDYCWLPKNEALTRLRSVTNKQAVERYVPD